jgi:cell division protein FtsL
MTGPAARSDQGERRIRSVPSGGGSSSGAFAPRDLAPKPRPTGPSVLQREAAERRAAIQREAERELEREREQQERAAKQRAGQQRARSVAVAQPRGAAKPGAGTHRAPAVDAPKRHLRVAQAAPARSVFGNWFLIVFWAAAVTAIMFVAVVTNATRTSRGATFDVLRNQVRAAELEHRRLRAEVAILEAPDRIATLALQRGLERPTEIRFLQSGSTARNAGQGTESAAEPVVEVVEQQVAP